MDAEFDAAVARLKELGYTVFSTNKVEHIFKFKNATGTYVGGAYVMTGDGSWCLGYYPKDSSDPGATYSYTNTGVNLVGMINELDPSWMNYGG